MADRHAPSGRVLTSGVSKSRAGMTSTHGVRRNLFQSHLTRRQPAPSSTSSEELHHDADAHKEHQNGHPFQTPPHAQPAEDDIVVRDHNGEDPNEMEALNSQQENERERQRLAEAVKQHQIDQHSMPAQPEGKDPSSSSTDSSKCSATVPHPPPGITPLTKTHDFQSTIELLEAVKASLRAKVAALDEDNWLYEREETPQHR
ncbi:hypothetical protein N0V88_001401 [Collariella sp. IMI 366227]|nr:hypothetical protein N0V88_001401 [Collariella sp. IMI 366227]